MKLSERVSLHTIQHYCESAFLPLYSGGSRLYARLSRQPIISSCPRCHANAKIIRFIVELDVIKKIRMHLELWRGFSRRGASAMPLAAKNGEVVSVHAKESFVVGVRVTMSPRWMCIRCGMEGWSGLCENRGFWFRPEKREGFPAWWFDEMTEGENRLDFVRKWSIKAE